MSFIGEYSHNMDAKGRAFIPAKFREGLGEHFVVTKGVETCLYLYPEDEWEVIEQRIKEMPMSKSTRSLQRYFFSSAADVEPDKQGRILLPQTLREHAKLSRELIIVGVSNRVEIWDKQLWEETIDTLSPEDIEETIGGISF
jgi:MraZ protein